MSYHCNYIYTNINIAVMTVTKSRKDTQSFGTTPAARDSALLALRSVYATTRRQLAVLRRTTGLGSALVWALAEIEEQPGLRVGDLAGMTAIE
jgi:hypothetical protein